MQLLSQHDNLLTILVDRVHHLQSEPLGEYHIIVPVLIDEAVLLMGEVDVLERVDHTVGLFQEARYLHAHVTDHLAALYLLLMLVAIFINLDYLLEQVQGGLAVVHLDVELGEVCHLTSRLNMIGPETLHNTVHGRLEQCLHEFHLLERHQQVDVDRVERDEDRVAVAEVRADRLQGCCVDPLCLLRLSKVEVGAHEHCVEAHATCMHWQEVVQSLISVLDSHRPLSLVERQLGNLADGLYVCLTGQLLCDLLFEQGSSQS